MKHVSSLKHCNQNKLVSAPHTLELTELTVDRLQAAPQDPPAHSRQIP